MSHRVSEVHWTKQFSSDYSRLPQVTQKKLARQLQMLTTNQRYPSLRLRKMVDEHGIWEARVDRCYRFTFERVGNTLYLRTVGRHAVLNAP